MSQGSSSCAYAYIYKTALIAEIVCGNGRRTIWGSIPPWTTSTITTYRSSMTATNKILVRNEARPEPTLANPAIMSWTLERKPRNGSVHNGSIYKIVRLSSYKYQNESEVCDPAGECVVSTYHGNRRRRRSKRELKIMKPCNVYAILVIATAPVHSGFGSRSDR